MLVDMHGDMTIYAVGYINPYGIDSNDLLWTRVVGVTEIGCLWSGTMTTPLLDGARARKNGCPKFARGDPLNPTAPQSTQRVRRASSTLRASLGGGSGCRERSGEGGGALDSGDGAYAAYSDVLIA